MFGHRYFGARHFGPHYWGDGGDATALVPGGRKPAKRKKPEGDEIKEILQIVMQVIQQGAEQ
jgi:hypothetical protein